MKKTILLSTLIDMTKQDLILHGIKKKQCSHTSAMGLILSHVNIVKKMNYSIQKN